MRHHPPIGIYVHVPFCRARCSYCAFFTVSHADESFTAYLDDLLAEIDIVARAGRPLDGLPLPSQAGRRVDTVYLGGGTPSLLPPTSLERLLDRIARRFDLTAAAEITLEANPETVTRQSAAAWQTLGINRVSVGAQTFDPETLRRLGRLHEPDAVARSVAFLRDAGSASVSIDLIAGVQPEGLARDLDRVCELEPEHVSVYLLEVDELEMGTVTPLARQAAAGRAAVPENDWYADAWPQAVARLAAAGIERYEICNFARPGHACRHNLKYWRCEEVIGFGPSAHSLAGGTRWSNPADMDRWRRPLAAGRLPDAHVDSRTQLQADAERAILALRLTQGIAVDQLEKHLCALRTDGRSVLDDLLAGRLLVVRDHRATLTTRGVLLSNEIFQDLLPASGTPRVEACRP